MKFIRILLSFLTLISTTSAEQGADESIYHVTMVNIPAGSYTPLYTTEKTPRKVSAFSIDTLPVTKKQFLAFVSENPKWQRSKISRIFADRTYLLDWKSDTNPGTDLESPVTNVSWFAARAYAKHLGKRLPTVDEWEFIARADQSKANATSEDSYTQTILNWYAAPNKSPLPKAHTFPKNFYGIQALHGLIWEWNEDFNNTMFTGESRGDSGLERNLFCAGGAVSATDVRNYAAFMRYAFRSSLKGKFSTINLGFRCASSPKNHNQQPN